jgi:hypothetical protein
MGTRFSDRLATKNPEDVPILELAKNITRAKNLDKDGGNKTNNPTVLNSSNCTLIDI